MSYKNSDGNYKAFPKTPRHKTGTKRHKNFDEVSASFASKLGASGRDDCSDDQSRQVFNPDQVRPAASVTRIHGVGFGFTAFAAASACFRTSARVRLEPTRLYSAVGSRSLDPFRPSIQRTKPRSSISVWRFSVFASEIIANFFCAD